jgi:ABC-type transporter Mla MlaB component
MEVDIYPYTDKQEKTAKGKRSKKEKVSPPKQKNLNDKNARRYLTWLANTNFDESGFHTSLTYAKKNLPETIEEAERNAKNFLNRVAYARRRAELPPLKYILVTEVSLGKDGETPVRVHHHIIMNGGLDRDAVEDLWRNRRQKGQKKGDKIGYANADRLQPDENGLAGLCEYITKNRTVGKDRWSSSKNLTKPQQRTNDYAYSRKKVEEIAKAPPGAEYWAKRYKGWTPAPAEYGFGAKYNDVTGWALHLKMHKKE